MRSQRNFTSKALVRLSRVTIIHEVFLTPREREMISVRKIFLCFILFVLISRSFPNEILKHTLMISAKLRSLLQIK